MHGNPDRRMNAPREPLDMGVLCDSESVTYPKPRRSAGRMLRLYWLQALAFVVFLVVVYLFAALGYVGN